MRRLRKAKRSTDDSGFGLIETVVALLIAGVVFGALATTLIAAVKSSLFSRQNQQAADYMTQALEEMRLLDYGALAINPAGLSSDPRVTTVAGVPYLDVNGTPERIVTADPTGLPAATTLSSATTNYTSFTLRRYVTVVPGMDTDLVRRATVYIAWTGNGTEHQRTTSTVISYGQRGLPLPSFRLEPGLSSVSINPGAEAVHKFTLANQGAPDRWNLGLTGDTTSFGLYADTNGDGVYTSGSDLALGDTSSDGLPDTGRIDPGTAVTFFLVFSSSTSTSTGTLTTTLSASSAGQPPPASSPKTAVATTVVTTGAVGPTPGPSPTTPPASAETVCSATAVTGSTQNQYTLTSYALHNEGPADSVTLAQLYMNTAAPSRSVLGQYSTDVAPGITGRQLSMTPAATDAAVLALTDATTYVDWAYQFPVAARIQGTAVLRMWVAAPTGPAPAVQLRAVVYTKAAGGTAPRVPIAAGTVTLGAGCAGFQEVFVTFSDIQPHVSLSANQWMGVRLVNNGPATVRLGYDEPWQVPAVFTLGVQ